MVWSEQDINTYIYDKL